MTSSSSPTSPSSLDAHVVATKLDAIHYLLLTIAQRQEVLHHGQVDLFRKQYELREDQMELRRGQVELRTGQVELYVGQQMLLANEEKNRDDILAEINDVFTDLVAVQDDDDDEQEEQEEQESQSGSEATLVADPHAKVANTQSFSSGSSDGSHSGTRGRSMSPRRQSRSLAAWSAKVGGKVKSRCRHSLSKWSSLRPQEEDPVTFWSMPFSELGLELTSAQEAETNPTHLSEEQRNHQVRMHILQVIREHNLETDAERIYGCH